jgi:hypothetical protein
MKIKDQTIKEIQELKPTELIKVYDMIMSLKKKTLNARKEKSFPAYLKVRAALKQCMGSLSEDVSAVREDRV